MSLPLDGSGFFNRQIGYFPDQPTNPESFMSNFAGIKSPLDSTFSVNSGTHSVHSSESRLPYAITPRTGDSLMGPVNPFANSITKRHSQSAFRKTSLSKKRHISLHVNTAAVAGQDDWSKKGAQLTPVEDETLQPSQPGISTPISDRHSEISVVAPNRQEPNQRLNTLSRAEHARQSHNLSPHQSDDTGQSMQNGQFLWNISQNPPTSQLNDLHTMSVGSGHNDQVNMSHSCFQYPQNVLGMAQESVGMPYDQSTMSQLLTGNHPQSSATNQNLSVEFPNTPEFSQDMGFALSGSSIPTSNMNVDNPLGFQENTVPGILTANLDLSTFPGSFNDVVPLESLPDISANSELLDLFDFSAPAETTLAQGSTNTNNGRNCTEQSTTQTSQTSMPDDDSKSMEKEYPLILEKPQQNAQAVSKSAHIRRGRRPVDRWKAPNITYDQAVAMSAHPVWNANESKEIVVGNGWSRKPDISTSVRSMQPVPINGRNENGAGEVKISTIESQSTLSGSQNTLHGPRMRSGQELVGSYGRVTSTHEPNIRKINPPSSCSSGQAKSVTSAWQTSFSLMSNPSSDFATSANGLSLNRPQKMPAHVSEVNQHRMAITKNDGFSHYMGPETNDMSDRNLKPAVPANMRNGDSSMSQSIANHHTPDSIIEDKTDHSDQLVSEFINIGDFEGPDVFFPMMQSDDQNLPRLDTAQPLAVNYESANMIPESQSLSEFLISPTSDTKESQYAQHATANWSSSPTSQPSNQIAPQPASSADKLHGKFHGECLTPFTRKPISNGYLKIPTPTNTESEASAFAFEIKLPIRSESVRRLSGYCDRDSSKFIMPPLSMMLINPAVFRRFVRKWASTEEYLRSSLAFLSLGPIKNPDIYEATTGFAPSWTNATPATGQIDGEPIKIEADSPLTVLEEGPLRCPHPTCPLFGSGFRSEVNFKHHLTTSHRDNVSCPICGIQLSRTDAAKRHILRLHPEDSRRNTAAVIQNAINNLAAQNFACTSPNLYFRIYQEYESSLASRRKKTTVSIRRARGRKRLKASDDKDAASVDDNQTPPWAAFKEQEEKSNIEINLAYYTSGNLRIMRKLLNSDAMCC